MDVRLIPPIFTRAPAQYEQTYFNDLIRALISLITYIQAPGEGRQTTIVLTNLASNDSGLEPGTIFQVDGALRISVINKAYVAGLSATGRVGSVTVTL
jgi:hypothetical protein